MYTLLKLSFFIWKTTAVQKAVESERMLLEQERQRALIEEQVLREKEQSARAAREKGKLCRS